MFLSWTWTPTCNKGLCILHFFFNHSNVHICIGLLVAMSSQSVVRTPAELRRLEKKNPPETSLPLFSSPSRSVTSHLITQNTMRANEKTSKANCSVVPRTLIRTPVRNCQLGGHVTHSNKLSDFKLIFSGKVRKSRGFFPLQLFRWSLSGGPQRKIKREKGPHSRRSISSSLHSLTNLDVILQTMYHLWNDKKIQEALEIFIWKLKKHMYTWMRTSSHNFKHCMN